MNPRSWQNPHSDRPVPAAGRKLSTRLLPWICVCLAWLVLSCQSETRIINPTASDGQPLCRLDVSALDFGAVILGETAMDTLRLRNIGTGVLQGQIDTNSPHFRLVGGGARYSLAPGAGMDVILAFQPVEAGALTCTVDFGNACTRTVSCAGVALTPADCVISESQIDFGPVPVGSIAERIIVLENRGDADLPLYTQPELSCDALGLSPLPLPEALAGGQRLDLVLTYAPEALGSTFCLVELSPECTVDFTLQGQAVRPAECVIDPPAVSFGLVDRGDVRTADVTIRNTGDAPLSGAAALVLGCDTDISIVAGAGAFELAGGATHRVTLRFVPTTAGVASCTLDLGPHCPSVSVSGTGDLAAICTLSDSAIEFDQLIVGEERTISFDITNTGGSRLQGNVVPTALPVHGSAATCADVAVLVGGGFYELREGQTQRVTVRWRPSAAGAINCGLDLGAVCGMIPMSGQSFEPPVCAVSDPALDFGTVFVGESVTRSVTLRNDGGSDLSGAVDLAENCQGFSIVTGGGAYVLEPGEQSTIVVRFAPSEIASRVCKLLLGSGCANVTLSAFGDRVAECTRSASSLEFGTVTLGASLDRTVQVTNTGGSRLTGTVSLAGDADFNLVAGSGAFDLGAGEFRSVTVRLAPTTAGSKSATLSLGPGLCAPIACEGAAEPPSACGLSTPEIDFGGVVVGASEQRSFVLRNTGGGVLGGSVALGTCAAGFSILAGAGDFALPGGDSLQVVIAFAPVTAGDAACVVELGEDCGSLATFGYGLDPADCVVTVPRVGAIDFGTVTIGDVRDTTVTLTNPGDLPLSGTLSLSSCASAFSFAGVSGSFELLPGMSLEVPIEFAPGTAGPQACTLGFGDELCGSIALSGVGDEPPNCDLSDEVISFGSTPLGVSVNRTLQITNTGGGRVVGQVPASTGCAPFQVIAGSGAFDLAGGQTRLVQLRFTPSESGLAACALDLGTDCGTVNLSGMGDDPPECTLTPGSLNFGTIPVGGSSTKSFTIRNDGGGNLHGAVGLFPCADFDILSGNGSFDLGAGQSKTITVEFSPTAAVTRNCTVSIGNDDCGNLSMTGQGEAGPECEINVSSLNFGSVIANGSTSQDRSFTVENAGGGVLQCNVSAGCSYYTVVANGGYFTLSAGQSRTVTVRYRPGSNAFGTHNCTISVASGCSVPATGRGVAGFAAHVRRWVQDPLPDGRTCSVHHNWTYDATIPETSTSNPVGSDIIQKPGNAAVAHTGGYFSYFDAGGTARTLILQWINDGRRQ